MTKIVKRDFQWYLDKWCESHVSSIIQVLAKYAESTWILSTSRGYSVPNTFKFTSLIWMLPFQQLQYLVLLHLCFSHMPSCRTFGNPSKTFLGIMPVKGGGVPPLSAKLFWAQWLSVKGGGEYPPIPLRKKSAKNSYFWPKNAYFSPFWPIFLGKFSAIFR